MDRKILLLVLMFGLASCSEDDGVIDTSVPSNRSSFTGLLLQNYEFDTDTLNIPQTGDKRETDQVTIPVRYSFRSVPAQGTTLDAARITVRQENSETNLIDTTVTAASGTEFCGTILLRIARNDVGEYIVGIGGKDGKEVEANPVLSKISVMYGKYPPELYNLTAPDSVKRPATDTTFIISVAVRDKSGQKDIKTVFFSSFKPDGSPTATQKFVMYDDGSNGDSTPGDGIYSRGVTLSSTNELGSYRFEIQAFDRSNLPATPIVHYINIYQ